MKRGPFNIAQRLREAQERAERAEAERDAIRKEFTQFTVESNERYNELRALYYTALDELTKLRARLDNISDGINSL